MVRTNYLKGKTVLFFGLKNCKNSFKAINHLKSKGCIVTVILGRRRGEDLPLEVLSWQGDYIFSYRCYWLIPKAVIQKAKLMALNFHPATPDYPGSGSYSWAIYNESKEYGITIHLMSEEYDSGKILDVHTFKLNDYINVENLINKNYEFSLISFKNFINKINTKSNEEINRFKNKESNFKWQGKPKKLSDLNKMRNINLNVSKNELSKRIKAFHFKDYPILLSLHGFKFRLSLIDDKGD